MEKFEEKLKGAIVALYNVELTPEIAEAPAETGADYATNVAMKLAKVAHKAPMQIAEELKAEIEAGASGFSLSVAAPGFLNIRVDDKYFADEAKKLAGQVELGIKDYADKTVITEFSDPNPFKVLHVGHLYTSVVGDGISRLLELAGAKVIRANFGGDVGLHVAKTMYALRKTLTAETSSSADALLTQRTLSASRSATPVSSNSLAESASLKTMDELKIEDVAKCYVEGTQAYEDDETAKAEITKLNKEIYRINAEGDHEGALAQLYWKGRELSYEYFEDFYAKIGVKFDKYYPESAVAGRGLKEVKEHTGEIYEESEGAVVFRGEKMGLHTRVFINREGVPTYEAKDVGLIFTKWDDWHFDESIVVTGNEQSEYMKVVLASVNEYAPELVERTRHLTHGLVKLPGNVKMSSRKGNFLKAVDVLEMIREMLGGDKADEKVVLAAIKYAFLKYKMGGDIVFDPQESVSTNGNSGVYLLYSAVRAKKILAKAGVGGDATGEISVYERNLDKKLVGYREVVVSAVREKAPYKVCNYLYELAQEFSRFYENVKVAGSEREAELMLVVRAYLNVMEHGLGLLGIEVPEEM